MPYSIIAQPFCVQWQTFVGVLFTRLSQSVALGVGRHMLTEMVVDNYIPNDTHMTEEEARIQASRWYTLKHSCSFRAAPWCVSMLHHVAAAF